jgi:hypothetical protein
VRYSSLRAVSLQTLRYTCRFVCIDKRERAVARRRRVP